MLRSVSHCNPATVTTGGSELSAALTVAVQRSAAAPAAAANAAAVWRPAAWQRWAPASTLSAQGSWQSEAAPACRLAQLAEASERLAIAPQFVGLSCSATATTTRTQLPQASCHSDCSGGEIALEAT